MYRNAKKVRVEVLEVRGGKSCEAGLAVGEIFALEEFHRQCPCRAASNVLYPPGLALQYGALLPWEEDGSTARVACPDPDCTVVFRLSVQDLPPK